MLYVAEGHFAAALAEVTGERPVSPFFACPAVEDSALAARIWHLHRVLEGSPGRLAREAALVEVLVRLGLRYAAERPRPAGYALHRGIAQRAAGYLEGNIAGDVSLSELAEAVGVSRFHLLRVFRQETGLPPHAWLMQRRLGLAKQRLNRGEPPAAVAAALGFADQSHVNRRFRGAFGVTPGRYQRQSNRRQS
jgi:AraC-like DNA-binding protein